MKRLEVSRVHNVRASGLFGFLFSLVIGACLAQSAQSQNQRTEDPYSPAYGHPYRHGVVPTIEVWQKMKEWEAQHSGGLVSPLLSSNTLSFGGGIDGIGVTSGTPKVYVVFYGSQWQSGGDPNGAATYLQDLFAGIGTGGETWSGTMTQYCDGPLVSTGATSCPTGAPLVGYPSSGALAGVWFDNSGPAPSNATQGQVAAEAVAAAAHFGNTTAAANRYAQYIVAFPTGTNPDGFPNATFCAWHSSTSSSYGDVAYTLLPYITDAGSNCGENYVNGGSLGTLDGFSIIGGHEYAETLTDQNPYGGWRNASNNDEAGDECIWRKTGQGASADVSMGNGAYAMQSIWSNDTGECDISHTILSGGSVPSPPASISVGDHAACPTVVVMWSSVSGATSYQLWESLSGSFTSPFEVYSGAGTSAVESVSPHTIAYFKAAACDGAGCSALTTQTAWAQGYQRCP